MTTMERPVARKPSRRRRAAAASLLLLLAPPSPAALAAQSSSASPSFLDGRYPPSSPESASDVDAFADLDLDLRSIASALASSDGGLEMARETYETGTDGSTEDGTRHTLQTLSTRVEDVITIGSPTFAKFKEYYGRSDYADAWVRGAFDGTETEFDDGNYDFGEFDPEARGGECFEI